MLTRQGLITTILLLLSGMCLGQNPDLYDTWQVSPNNALVFGDSGDIDVVENNFNITELKEANSSIRIGNDLYNHTSTAFYKNEIQITNVLNGHRSSLQGSCIVPNIDTTKLIIIYSDSAFNGYGLGYSIFRI
ncbi:MAG: hypothetical protein ACI9NN_001051 [Bacteroidia bacterium]|jgi:hypothetical protein